MAWIGRSEGIFRLHDSDRYCGSYLSTEDAAEILGVQPADLALLPTINGADGRLISELEIHRAWGAGRIISPHQTKIGNATRSFDELIVMKLLEITFPGCRVNPQAPFGRKRVDIEAIHNGRRLLIEFVGPSHFIPQYQRALVNPLVRKAEAEEYFGDECVVWPFWIQRCTRNVRALFQEPRDGLASVWSTKALFGDFAYPDSADLIVEISSRFGAVKSDGLGYMYSNSHTSKPVHPIIEAVKTGKESRDRLIPRDNHHGDGFWLPEELRR